MYSYNINYTNTLTLSDAYVMILIYVLENMTGGVMGEFEYKEQMISQYRDKSEIMLRELPAICRTYYRGVEGNISSLTLYEYLTRQKVFFSFLIHQI